MECCVSSSSGRCWVVGLALEETVELLDLLVRLRPRDVASALMDELTVDAGKKKGLEVGEKDE